MFKNYVITAFRNLVRQKGSTFINISGLTLGITCSLILFLLVKHFTSYDNYHTNADRIYRLVEQSDGNQKKNFSPGVPSVLPDAFRLDFPEAEEVTFMSYRSETMVTIPQRNGEAKKYNEEKGVVFAQSNFFKIFDRPIVMGNGAKGLDNPNEAIISKKLALKYFGKEDAIGEVVKFDTMEYKITAVMDDYPANTDFPFDLMLSYISIKKTQEQNGWNSIWSDEQCYFMLKKNEPIAKVEARMPAFVDKYLGKENFNHQTFFPQPLSTLHSDDRFEPYTYKTVPNETVIALSIIALFLIVTACINFINLSTAEAIKRSKEVGIRKSLGSTRTQLIWQFIGETSLVTTIAMLISLGLTQLALTILNPFLEVNLALNFLSDEWLWAFVIGITAVVSLLSGTYPSFVVSGFKPALALKNQISNRNSSGYNLRRGLVVLQFVISQFFIIGTVILIGQMNYFKKTELGFRKDAIILFNIPEKESPATNGTSKMKTLRDELLRIPGIETASLSNTPPSSSNVNGTGFILDGESQEQRKATQVKQIDGNYLDLFDLKLVAGKGIEDSDTARGYLVNEQLVKVAGIKNPQDIIGRVISSSGRKLPVVGVVKNFHTVSLRSPIEPTILFNRIRGYETLSVKVNPAKAQEVIAAVKTKWEAAYPNFIFEYQFLDEHIREFYETEEKMSILTTIFTSMAIFIGCLGLFGLATFMANQKTKEIGVRKVLGASVESIVLQFSKEYIKLILVGFIFAAPLGWYVMNRYLDEFAYKITIGPLVFLLSFGVTLLIALFTVGYKSFKAAVMNPVKALRYE